MQSGLHINSRPSLREILCCCALIVCVSLRVSGQTKVPAQTNVASVVAQLQKQVGNLEAEVRNQQAN